MLNGIIDPQLLLGASIAAIKIHKIAIRKHSYKAILIEWYGPNLHKASAWIGISCLHASWLRSIAQTLVNFVRISAVKVSTFRFYLLDSLLLSRKMSSLILCWCNSDCVWSIWKVLSYAGDGISTPCEIPLHPDHQDSRHPRSFVQERQHQAIPQL